MDSQFRSPQLLLVSGIGPSTALENLGIPVIVDLPGVGQNMWVRLNSRTEAHNKPVADMEQDHIMFSQAYPVSVTTHSQLASPSFAAEQTAAYITNRTGMLTNSGGDILGFEATYWVSSCAADFFRRLCETSSGSTYQFHARSARRFLPRLARL